jgi:hypothetical protein
MWGMRLYFREVVNLILLRDGVVIFIFKIDGILRIR